MLISKGCLILILQNKCSLFFAYILQKHFSTQRNHEKLATPNSKPPPSRHVKRVSQIYCNITTLISETMTGVSERMRETVMAGQPRKCRPLGTMPTPDARNTKGAGLFYVTRPFFSEGNFCGDRCGTCGDLIDKTIKGRSHALLFTRKQMLFMHYIKIIKLIKINILLCTKLACRHPIKTSFLRGYSCRLYINKWCETQQNKMQLCQNSIFS